jgi:hypothetical protein
MGVTNSKLKRLTSMSNQTQNRRNPVAPTRYEGTYCNPFSDDAEELEAHETFATRAEAEKWATKMAVNMLCNGLPTGEATIYDTIRNETVFSAEVVRDNVPSTVEIFSNNSKKSMFYRLTLKQIKDIITS